MSYVCKYDISVPCNDKSIYSCDMCKEHPMYEQGREDERPKAFGAGYASGYEKGRADAIEEFVKRLESEKLSFWAMDVIYHHAKELKEKKNGE